VVQHPGGDPSQIMARFQREAVISAKLNHPHIITVFDVGEDPVLGPFMAMEYVDGATLADLIREKPPLETGLRLLAQTMSALVASEAAGIAHRDVKPDNILVSKDWRAKLLDFGIARGNEARLTQAGMVFGTPYYTAPEVLVGAEADSVSDRYSFAVTAFEVISGVLPFHGSSVGTVVYRIVNEPPEIPDAFNPALRAVFELALAKDPIARFPDLFTFMDALLEAVDLPEDARARLQHYVSELHTRASERPMVITQSLDKPPHARTTEIPGSPAGPNAAAETAMEEDPFDGPSYQTIMIPVLQKAPAEGLAAIPEVITEALPEEVPEALESPDAAEEVWMDSSHILPPEQMAWDTPLSPPIAQSPCEEPRVEKTLILIPAEPETTPEEPVEILQADISEPPETPIVQEVPQEKPPSKKARERPQPRSSRPWAAVLLVAGALGVAAFFLFHHRSEAPRTLAQSIVTISSAPGGANVYLDGQLAGKTPINGMQLEGPDHSLRIELTGYHAEARKIQPGEKTLHFALKPAGHPIPVASDPSGAEVFLNDHPMGITPIPALIIPSEGRQELVLRHAGYKDWSAVVDPDLPFPDTICLNPETGHRKRQP